MKSSLDLVAELVGSFKVEAAKGYWNRRIMGLREFRFVFSNLRGAEACSEAFRKHGYEVKVVES